MFVKVAVKTSGWVALNWVFEVFSLMSDCRDGRMVMLVFGYMAAWVSVRAAKRTANYIAVN